MSRRPKILLLLAISQAVCLAVGLWIQDRFVTALAQWNERSAVAPLDPAQSDSASPTTESTAEVETSAKSLREAMLSGLPLAFVWIAGLQTVVAYLVLMRMHIEHSQKELRSREESLVTAKKLARTRDAVIFGLAKLADSRDSDTAQHLERIALYSTRLATALRKHARYRDLITLNFVRSIGISSVLHDIGKVGIRDSILLKPGKLTAEEVKEMQRHTTIGGECIRQIEQRIGNSNFLKMAHEIAYCHHERWDGTGYPANLKGEQIPLTARIVAIVDVYDALASRRSYKEAFSHDRCVAIIREEAGTHFDPHLVSVFLSIEKEFERTSMRFREETQLDTGTCRAERLTDQKKTEPRPVSTEDPASCAKPANNATDSSPDPVSTRWTSPPDTAEASDLEAAPVGCSAAP